MLQELSLDKYSAQEKGKINQSINSNNYRVSCKDQSCLYNNYFTTLRVHTLMPAPVSGV